MDDELKTKVLRLAAQICWMHGSIAGDRICQDWSNDTNILDTLTEAERNILSEQYEEWNSNGEDYEPGYFPYDEMFISFIVARALNVMSGSADSE